MKRKPIIPIGALLLVFAVLYYYYGGGKTPKGQSPLTSLNGSNITVLKDAFNNSAASVRVLMLLSPT